MDEFVAIAAGLGLAAACGFRVFLPLLGVSLIAYGAGEAGQSLLLSSGYGWLGHPGVLVALSVATVVEIGGYYIPWLDNVLDTLTTPSAVVAGAFLSGAFMPESADSEGLRQVMLLVAGGGAAGAVQGASVVARAISSATTGGLANPVLATGELGGSVVLTVIALMIPIVAAAVVVVLLIVAIRMLIKRPVTLRRASDATPPVSSG